jgi:hypothetical protein
MALPEVSWYSAFLIKMFLKSIEFGEVTNFDLYDFIDFFLKSYLILLTVMFKYILSLLIILHRKPDAVYIS